MNTTPMFRNWHRFLVQQSFYPLVLASLLAGVLWSGRVMISRSLNYSMLIWNLFLAWLPYLCSAAAVLAHRRSPRPWLLILILGGGWLAFFPNAPYIVTDFYHLSRRYPIPLWYDICLIAIFAFTGCFLGIISLRGMHRLVERHFGRWVGWMFAAVALGLGGLGVYLGRFGRWNSWDLLQHPKAVLRDIALPILNPLDNLGFVGFTLIFTAILGVFYLMAVSNTAKNE